MAGIADFRLAAADLRPVGKDLSRPECIIAEPGGRLWISDNRGGVMLLEPDGRQALLGKVPGDPNGLAMDRNGAIVIANIGDGRVYRLDRDGGHAVLLEALDGQPLGAVNFVYIDERERLWITVSTRAEPRSDAIKQPRPDGYVLRVDADGPKRVADGFHFTNEIRIDNSGRYLYVAETAIGAVSRLPFQADGSLGPKETFGPAPLFQGALIDGITFDSDGNLWVTEITRNALIVISPAGNAHTVIEDPAGAVLNFPTSLTFGGPDLRTAYVGSLRMNHILSFRAPVAGAPLQHWRNQIR